MEGKAEKTFKDFGKRLDSIFADLEDLKENLKKKYGDRWDEINRNKSKLEDELNDIRERNKPRFEEAERNLENAGREIKNAFEAIFAKRETQGTPQHERNEEKSSDN